MTRQFRAVFDTSVLVAATRSREGASFALIADLPNPAYELALTVTLFTEWQAVLTRDEHLPPNGSRDDAIAFLRYLASISHLQDVHFLWRPFLRDPDDDMLVECAVASGSRYIVTHNVRDFQRVGELNIEPFTPAQFLRFLRSTT
jgi:putative PIN family toxin of toxin-antitoxin system